MLSVNGIILWNICETTKMYKEKWNYVETKETIIHIRRCITKFLVKSKNYIERWIYEDIRWRWGVLIQKYGRKLDGMFITNVDDFSITGTNKHMDKNINSMIKELTI